MRNIEKVQPLLGDITQERAYEWCKKAGITVGSLEEFKYYYPDEESFMRFLMYVVDIMRQTVEDIKEAVKNEI